MNVSKDRVDIISAPGPRWNGNRRLLRTVSVIAHILKIPSGGVVEVLQRAKTVDFEPGLRKRGILAGVLRVQAEIHKKGAEASLQV